MSRGQAPGHGRNGRVPREARPGAAAPESCGAIVALPAQNRHAFVCRSDPSSRVPGTGPGTRHERPWLRRARPLRPGAPPGSRARSRSAPRAGGRRSPAQRAASSSGSSVCSAPSRPTATRSSTTCISVSLLSAVIRRSRSRYRSRPRQPRREALHHGELVPRELELRRERPQPVDPPGRVQRLVHALEEELEPRVVEVVVGVADVAAQPPLVRERVFDRRAVVRDHPAELGRGRPVADDPPQERDVLGDRLERARRVEHHEAEVEQDPELLHRRDGGRVLGDAWSACAASRGSTRCPTRGPCRPCTGPASRISASSSGSAASARQLTFQSIRPTRSCGGSRRASAPRPAVPRRPEDREVVVLEQQDRRPDLVVQEAHLLGHLRRRRASARPCPGRAR